jgi:hypothetical protein
LQHEAITPSVSEIRVAVQAARRFGLRVTLRPFLDQVALKKFGNSYWSGSIAPRSRTRWFSSLYQVLLPYARLAQQLHVETFVVGSELTSLSNDPNWSPLLKRISQTYSGKLSYAVNWDTYPSGQVGVPVEKVGLDAYPPQSVGSKASVATLTKGWRDWLARTPAALRARTTIYELGILATDGAYAIPWAWSLRGKFDENIQSRWFRAACVAARAESLPGIFFWGITSTQSLIGPQGTTSPGSFVGRSGQTAIRWCFTHVY